MEKFLSGDAIYVNTRARGTAIDFMFGMSMRVLLLLTYIALPDPYFSTIVARKVSWTDSHHNILYLEISNKHKLGTMDTVWVILIKPKYRKWDSEAQFCM